MKPTHLKKWLVVALALANGFLAVAQTNNLPGPTAYADFSQFIARRNIFDPNRQPHTGSVRPRITHPQVTRSIPMFTLVGTMSYRKGMFAFFDGNSSDLRQALAESGSIAGFTVSEITLTGVKLVSADKKQTVELKLGDMMREEGQNWVPAGQGELPSNTTAQTGSGSGGSGSTGSSLPNPASAPNDILKKLMQQREQELK